MKVLLSLFLVFTLSASFVGCSSKDAKDDNIDTGSTVIDGDDISQDMVDKLSSDMGNAMGLETIRFAFDSDQLSSSAMASLKNSAQILRDNPSVQVQIEGHCDERGSVQYNLALGERRAKSVKRALARMGVDSSRLDTISYGKEQPLDPGSNEAAWAMNRRANFVITSK